MTERIVITGAGVICPIGAGVQEFERALYAGTTGVGASEMFGSERVTAEVRGFAPQQWLGNKGIRVLDRSARLLCVAAYMALHDAGLMQGEVTEGDDNWGLICGTMFGGLHSIASFDWSGLVDGPNYVNPMEFPNTVINSPAGQAAIRYKLRGINSTVCAGLASGLYAMQWGADLLRLGRARVLLAGGVDELCEESILGFYKTGVVSAAWHPNPFGADRDGIAPGEGSAFLVMESVASARERGATVLAEVAGFGCAHDAKSLNAFDVRAEGATAAIRQAIETSGIAADQIGCIVAGASGSGVGDAMESRALSNVFGERLERIPVCAPKASLGEAMGASGALGALAGMLALRKQIAPPTANFTTSDGKLLLSAEPQPFAGDYALVNAFGCDGNNAALVLRRAGE